MSLHLVYIGAVAALAPAASLRALDASGALFVPSDLEAGMLELIAGAATPNGIDGQVRPEGHRADTGGSGSLSIDDFIDWAGAHTATGVVFCVAGPHGPAMARALQARARQAGVDVTLTPAGALFTDALIGQDLVSLRDIIGVLRVQCPWDRVQTAADVVSYTVEEVYELADAIADKDPADQHGELGDLLMQVYFLAQLLEEQSLGDLGTVAEEIEGKLIRRHAHIFGEAVAETPGEVRGQWERIKREQEGRQGIFHDVPAALPALLLARKLQERAGAVGFDWETAGDAFPKIAEEHAELAEALGIPPDDRGAGGRRAVDEAEEGIPVEGSVRKPEAGASSQAQPQEVKDRLRHEVGDLLFAVVNVARKAGVDPELCLRQASRRFEQRVGAAAGLAQREGKDWATLESSEQESYYQRAKAGEGS